MMYSELLITLKYLNRLNSLYNEYFILMHLFVMWPWVDNGKTQIYLLAFGFCVLWHFWIKYLDYFDILVHGLSLMHMHTHEQYCYMVISSNFNPISWNGVYFSQGCRLFVIMIVQYSESSVIWTPLVKCHKHFVRISEKFR